MFFEKIYYDFLQRIFYYLLLYVIYYILFFIICKIVLCKNFFLNKRSEKVLKKF